MFAEYISTKFGYKTCFCWDIDLQFDEFFNNFLEEKDYKKFLRKKKLEKIGDNR